MIIHRSTADDFTAFEVASMMDSVGIRIVSIMQDHNQNWYAVKTQTWHVFGQGTDKQFQDFEIKELK